MRGRALAAGTAVLLALAGCSSAAPAAEPSPTGLTGELTVFAAASLQGAFDAIAAELAEQNPGVTVNPVTYDGSSTLATQLVDGASADVFASADLTSMGTVTDAGLADGAPTVFTTNTLEIVVAPGNPLGIETLADLAALSTSGGKVVLCGAEVPCGSAAHTVLDGAGLTLTPVSEEQNVKAVLTKVQTGDADAGLVYRTDVLAAGDTVEGVEFPEAATAVNEYPVVVLVDGERRAGVRRPGALRGRPADPGRPGVHGAVSRSGGGGVPRLLWPPAALAAGLLVMPIVALVVRADWSTLPADITTPAALDALWLSLSTSVVATGVCLVLGVPLAVVLARAHGWPADVLRALVTLPLVLPPTVGGIALLYLLGRRGLVGESLDAWFGITIPFTTAAVVIAQAFVAMPFLVLSVEGSLRTAGTGSTSSPRASAPGAGRSCDGSPCRS